MTHSTGFCVISLGVSAILLVGACGRAHPTVAVQPPPPPEEEEEAPHVKTSMVSASAVVSACPDGRKMNAKLAAHAIQHLVDPCRTVPGGSAHFSVALLPGGKVELAAPDGNPVEGVVPTCVLRHGLMHKVLLHAPCKFDVQLEERNTIKPAGSAGPG